MMTWLVVWLIGMWKPLWFGFWKGLVAPLPHQPEPELIQPKPHQPTPNHPAGGQEVPLPLPVKDAFHAAVCTCAVSRDGLGSLEEAILQVGFFLWGGGGALVGACLG
jgi:hypothetical protein